MARLTARDYKKSQRRALDLARLKEFGAGALVGAVLTSTPEVARVEWSRNTLSV